MPRTALLLVDDDPRDSHRAAEAIRIVAGLAPWEKVHPSLYFHGPAVLALSEMAEEFVDEEHFRRYLPLLAERGVKLYVEKGQPLLDGLGAVPVDYIEVSREELASVAAASDLVFRF